MPKRGGRFYGNFDDYAGMAIGGFPDDEEAISSASDEMFSMCGNAGQETLIGDYLADFEEWAYTVLETEDASKDSWNSFSEMVINDWYDGRIDKWDGTYLIWQRGFEMVASMYGHHDSTDEHGEGTGR